MDCRTSNAKLSLYLRCPSSEGGGEESVFIENDGGGGGTCVKLVRCVLSMFASSNLIAIFAADLAILPSKRSLFSDHLV